MISRIKDTRLVHAKKSPGFTLVELLVVLVILGILVSVSVFSYNGITIRTNNIKKFENLQQWSDIILKYRSKRGGDFIPTETPLKKTSSNAWFCLGLDFPEGDHCWIPSNSSLRTNGSPSLMQELAMVGVLPPQQFTSETKIPSGMGYGPIVEYKMESNELKYILSVSDWFIGKECPKGAKILDSDLVNRVVHCSINLD